MLPYARERNWEGEGRMVAADTAAWVRSLPDDVAAARAARVGKKKIKKIGKQNSRRLSLSLDQRLFICVYRERACPTGVRWGVGEAGTERKHV
jgi:hypothetical protein